MRQVKNILLKSIDAITKLDLPALICCNADMIEDLKQENCTFDPEMVRFVGSIPFDFVFPSCRCVIHHGGAGTTTAVAYAGVPGIVIPIFHWSDQPYWGRVVSGKNIGISIPLSAATTDSIAEAILSSNGLAKNCITFSKQLKNQPDGALVSAMLILDYCSSP